MGSVADIISEPHDGGGDAESATTFLIPKSSDKIPKDSFHLAYITYFVLGSGYLLPWNAFITAVDYFSYLYPGTSVDRVFAIVYMLVGLVCLLLIIAFEHKTTSFVRINGGLVVFALSLLVVPLMDVWYVKGEVGVYGAYYVTVCLVGLCGIGDPLGWLVTSEIFPLEIRSAAQSVTVAVGFFFTFLIAQTFLAMLCNFKSGLFFFFGGWVAIMTAFVHFLLPETTNVPMEKMDQIWREHWFWKKIVQK